MADEPKKEKEIKFDGVFGEIAKQHPEVVQGLLSDIEQRPARLNVLKERVSFLNEQMKLLKAQADLYTTTGQTMPESLLRQVDGLHGQILRVGKEYEREYNNANPVELPDADDQLVELDGEEVPVNKDILNRALQGDLTAMRQIDELQFSEDPAIQKEAKAIIRSVGEQFFSRTEEQTRFKDNGEVEIVNSTNPVEIAPVNTAPAMPDVAKKNSGIIETIKSALFRGETTAHAAVAESKSAIQSNLSKVKE